MKPREKGTVPFCTKPIEGVEAGKAAPWFDQPGGGMQYKLPMKIEELIDAGYIERID